MRQEKLVSCNSGNTLDEVGEVGVALWMDLLKFALLPSSPNTVVTSHVLEPINGI